MKETIEWHPASEPPDSSRWVLLLAPMIRIGFYNGDKYMSGTIGHTPAVVTHWAELPRGPQS